MKTETRKVYFCDHCKKHNLSASSISRHEKYCRLKPENRHKCFDTCVHLKKSVKLINDNRDPEYRYSYKAVFKCAVTGVKMYSYLLEKKANFKPEYTKGLTRMPVECKDHKYMTDLELEQRFNIEI